MSWKDRQTPKQLTPEQIQRYKDWSAKRETQSLLEDIREDIGEAVKLLASNEQLLASVPNIDTDLYTPMQTVATTFSTAGVNLRLVESALGRLNASIERVAAAIEEQNRLMKG